MQLHHVHGGRVERDSPTWFSCDNTTDRARTCVPQRSDILVYNSSHRFCLKLVWVNRSSCRCLCPCHRVIAQNTFYWHMWHVLVIFHRFSIVFHWVCGRLIFIHLQCWGLPPFLTIQRQQCIKTLCPKDPDFLRSWCWSVTERAAKRAAPSGTGRGAKISLPVSCQFAIAVLSSCVNSGLSKLLRHLSPACPSPLGGSYGALPLSLLPDPRVTGLGRTQSMSCYCENEEKG